MLDTTTQLTDDGIAPFNYSVKRTFRSAEAPEELRDARVVNDKKPLFGRLVTALIAAKAAAPTWR